MRFCLNEFLHEGVTRLFAQLRTGGGGGIHGFRR
jgi:hypothetical protein